MIDTAAISTSIEDLERIVQNASEHITALHQEINSIDAHIQTHKNVLHDLDVREIQAHQNVISSRQNAESVQQELKHSRLTHLAMAGTSAEAHAKAHIEELESQHQQALKLAKEHENNLPGTLDTLAKERESITAKITSLQESKNEIEASLAQFQAEYDKHFAMLGEAIYSDISDKIKAHQDEIERCQHDARVEEWSIKSVLKSVNERLSKWPELATKAQSRFIPENVKTTPRMYVLSAFSALLDALDTYGPECHLSIDEMRLLQLQYHDLQAMTLPKDFYVSRGRKREDVFHQKYKIEQLYRQAKNEAY